MKSPSAGVLAICEDDPDIRSMLGAFFRREGFDVELVADARALDRLLAERQVGLILLDWMLPGEDGLSICRRLQLQGGPAVLMLTARDADCDKIAGLETGADSYLTKPINPQVLLAHVRAALRKTAAATVAASLVCVGDLVIDIHRRQVTCAGRPVALSDGEFAVLSCLVQRPQRVLSREHLLAATRGRELRLYDRAIDAQISRLRSKLARGGSQVGELIRPVRSVGYILTAAPHPC